MTTSLSRGEKLGLLTLSVSCFGILANTFQGDGEPLIASLAFSGIAFASSYCLIRWLGTVFMAAGLKGRDMAKARKPEMCVFIASSYEPRQGANRILKKKSPEMMGAVCAAVYLFTLICFIPFPFYKDIVAATSGGGNRDVVIELEHLETGRFLHRFPHSKVCQ